MQFVLPPESFVMMPAHTVRIGFQEGCLDRADVGDWVAEQIDAHDVPPALLLDLVPLVGRDDSEIDAALRSLAPAIDSAIEARLRIDVLCDGYRRGRITLHDVALRLEYSACQDTDQLDQDVRDAAMGLHDALELARTGVYGTVEDAERAVREFVADHGRPLC